LVARLEVPLSVVEEVARREGAELDRRRRAYRGDRPPVVVAGRCVVVIDDGLATGFTARAAVEVVRRRRAARVIVAVPVGAPEAVSSLASVADEVVCLEMAGGFTGISQWYRDFDQVTDDEVTRLLAGSPAP
jgi:putative phosphoribosyl transferase